MKQLFALVLAATVAGAYVEQSRGATPQAGDSTPADPLIAELRTLAPAGRSAVVVDAAGISKSGRRMVSLETTEPLTATMRRLAIVGGVESPASGGR